MKGFILNGAMFRVLATGDVLQAHHVFGSWGNTYAIWESAVGWHAAIKILGTWNKLRGEAYKSEKQALEDGCDRAQQHINQQDLLEIQSIFGSMSEPNIC